MPDLSLRSLHAGPVQAPRPWWVRRKRGLLVPLCLIMAAAQAPAQTPSLPDPPAAHATLVLHNARIHTMDAQRHEYSAIALRGSTILALGDEAAVAAWSDKATRRIDLHGQMVLPGFIDAHIHAVYGAFYTSHCDLGGRTLSVQALVKAGKACLAKEHSARPGDWLQIVGISAIGVPLDRHVVDAITTTRPVVLWGVDGHLAWINTAALKALKVRADTPNPPGGRIGHDASGEPDGLFLDNALPLITAPTPPEHAVLPLARGVLDKLSAAGITSIQEADAGAIEFTVYPQLARRGQLNQRVRLDQHMEPVYDPTAIAAALRVSQEMAQFPLLRADAVKLFLDGTIEYPYQSAALLQPYRDAKGVPTASDGGRYYDRAALQHIVADLDARGMSFQIHAIGDRATHEFLDALEAARQAGGEAPADVLCPTPVRRHQISHMELVDDADIPRMARLGVIANLQLLWAMPDTWTVDAVLPYLGAQRHRNVYAARSLRDGGVRLAGGSDWTVSSYDPLLAIAQGMTRDMPAAVPAAERSALMDTLYPEQRLDLDTMLAMYTINAAYALGNEALSGSLEPGKRADLVVLDRDLTQLEPHAIADAKVTWTIFDGRVVYRRAAAHPAKAGQ